MSVATHRLTTSFFRQLLTLAAAFVVSISLHASDEAKGSGWTEKYDEAIAASKKSGMPILAHFSGGDFSLYREVFNTQEFKEWAPKNVVLLELDVPYKKTEDAARKSNNGEFEEKYQIKSYPTVVILDATGKKLGEIGYKAGGPKVWIAEFTKLYKAGDEK